MSEEQIAEALGAGNEELPDNLEQLVEDRQDEQPDLSPAEQKAWDDGWRPEDQFEGNPENWKTAGEYNLYGEMQTQVRDAKAESRRTQQEMDSRIASLNKLHAAQQEAAISDLKAQQRQAVEEADTDKFDRLQTQIENTVVEAPVAQPVDQDLAEWNAANTWISDGSEKAQDTHGWYGRAMSQPGATTQSVLAYVNKRLTEVYPDQQAPTNPRRESATMTEQSRQPRQRQRNGKELSMNDLTASERGDYEKFGKLMFSTEKEFLKSVSDARKA
jgi:hypothetical protein